MLDYVLVALIESKTQPNQGMYEVETVAEYKSIPACEKDIARQRVQVTKAVSFVCAKRDWN